MTDTEIPEWLRPPPVQVETEYVPPPAMTVGELIAALKNLDPALPVDLESHCCSNGDLASVTVYTTHAGARYVNLEIVR